MRVVQGAIATFLRRSDGLWVNHITIITLLSTMGATVEGSFPIEWLSDCLHRLLAGRDTNGAER